MTLVPGARLGPYEILGPLGAGGMGEVYRARDTRLDREVAVKILADRLAGNPESRARFEREAKSVAALSHPNILALHDVGTSGDHFYAVTELLQGATLAERLAGPPLPARKVIDFARQMVRGLSAAHERGVVHRDLKPDNVFITSDGLVKILDFGLARAAGPPAQSAAESGASRIATLGPATEPGAVLGTVGYMSPEQVRGLPLDARSDLFSFGAVLYEMLTGRRAFQADTAADTMSSILREEPPEVTVAGRGVPPALDRILRHCLEKNPAERFQSARDLVFSLEAAASPSTGEAAPVDATVPSRAARRGFPVRALGLLAAGGVLGAAMALLWGRPAAVPPPVLRTLTYSGGDSAPSASRDGRLIAYASEREGPERVWLKQHPGGDEIALTTGPDTSPRISPDGSQVLFVRHETNRDSLFRIPVVGGEPRKVVDDAFDGDWSPDGRRIVFLRPGEGGLRRQSAIGVADANGEGARVVAQVESRLDFVRWSPDGTTVAVRSTGGENVPHVMLLVNIDTGSRRTLVPPPPPGAISAPAWSGDGRSLIYGQLESFTTTNVAGGAARVLRQDIASGDAEILMWIPSPAGVIDVLSPGRLVMDVRSMRSNLMDDRIGGPAGWTRGHWLTRGSSIDRQPGVSPDGEWVIFSSNRTGNLDLWKLSLSDGSLRRITEDAADDWDPAFTPDGKGIIWSSGRSGHFEIWACGADGTGARQVTSDGIDAENPTMTGDGRWIVYNSSNPEHSGLWKIHPDGTGAVRVVPGEWSTPEVSLDGRWVAFRSQALPRVLRIASLENGEIQPFPIHFTGDLFPARPRWMPGTGALAFTGYDAAGALGVFLQDFVPGLDTSATRRPLSVFDPDLPIESFGISPDGSRVIYSRLEATSTLMLAEGLPGIEPPARPDR